MAISNSAVDWVKLSIKYKTIFPEDRYLKLQEVCRKTGKSKAAIYRDISDGTFPPPTRIGKRSIAWRLSIIEGWMEHVEQVGG